MTGTIFDIKRFSLHDGPGIRTTVFMKGCPLACDWCHNPESQELKPVLLYRSGLCLLCGLCVQTCPQEALAAGDGAITRDSSRCVVCGGCAERCPAEAVSRVGYSIDVESLSRKLSSDRLFFEESGGGVTFSGGEPLCQPGFLAEMLDRCRKLRLHCAVDTSGYADPHLMVDIARRADMILFDVKLVDPRQHERYTGVSNAGIFENLRLISEMGISMEIRIPIIPGITDTRENLDAATALILALPNVPPVRLLGHHHAAMSKYERFGMKNKLGEKEDPLPIRMAEIAAGMISAGLEVSI